MSLSRVNRFPLVIACFWLFIANAIGQGIFDEKHIEVSLRMIGHQVLFNSGDSTSRVLPIVKDSGQYTIQFESGFAFNPDELVNTVNQVIEDTKIAVGYIMQVQQCETEEVVYSYEIGDIGQIDLIPCLERAQPHSCYNLVFTLLSATSGLTLGTSDTTEDRNAETSRLNAAVMVLFFVLAVVLIFYLLRRRKRSTINSNLIKLGNYHFDQHNAVLIMQEKRTDLTSKEADLLYLLYETVNTTVERDVILNKVWGDEGDYIGRTIDVFISKLRKKLEADPNVKIINIRGVGYKLVVSE